MSCQPKEEAAVLPKDKLAAVYSDMVFAKELYSGNPAKYTSVRDSVLRVHGTDTSAIREAFSYYANDTEALDEIYQMAMDRAEQRSKIDTSTVPKDTLAVDSTASTL